MNDDAHVLLRHAGLRVTAGRTAVLDALLQMPHADADSIFKTVSESTPTSIQSVHNILADLTGVGLLRRIEPAGSPARYERRTGDNHHHVVCRSCGAISDVDCVVGAPPCLDAHGVVGFEVDEAEVTFWGTCTNCATARSVTS